jgi:CDGSH-type Zn-finger protein
LANGFWDILFPKKWVMKGEKRTKGKVSVTKNGPYLVSGGLPLAKEIIDCLKEKDPVKWTQGDIFSDQESYALCRCGHSGHKPFCDGSHVKAGFNGTETASRKKYLEQCETYEGAGTDLTDVQKLCSVARFCHRGGGTWKLVEGSGDPKAKKLIVQECADCPSGRLVAWDKRTGKAIEPEFEPSVGITEDPQYKVSGPIRLKGGIPVVGADGKEYEIRNRVTLCRCGKSKNKPFCDGAHIAAKFNDGDKSVL